MNYFSPTPGSQDCEVDSRVTKAGRTLAFAEVQSSSFVLRVEGQHCTNCKKYQIVGKLQRPLQDRVSIVN